MKGKETKSLNHEFETISTSDGAGSNELDMHDKFYASKNYQTTSKDEWLEITDPSIIDLIMRNYGDTFGRNILLCVADTPRTITGILRACAVPQTTGYRRILKLIEDKLLVPFDAISKSGGKRLRQYTTTFKDVQIRINEKVITINARPNSNAKLESQVNFLKRL